MKEYTVTWTIEVCADNAMEAAKMALDIQRDPDSTALFFSVSDNGLETAVDLSPEYNNYYRCYNCGYEWDEIYTCACDSECVECGQKNISPYKSDDI